MPAGSSTAQTRRIMSMPNFRDEIIVEMLRLTRRCADLRLMIAQAKRELPVIEQRSVALFKALEAWGDTECERVAADDYITDHYALGWPATWIAEMAGSMTGSEWSEDQVDARAAELGVRRPPGWDAARAKQDFDAADTESSDNWLYAAYGLPPFSDAPAPLALPSPEPKVALPVIPAPPPEQAAAPEWTNECIAIVERDYPTYRPKDDIVADVNALPGGEITDNQFNAMVVKLRLRRPADFMSRLRAERRPEDYMTSERLDVAKRLIADGQAPGQYCPVLARMPGPPLPADKTVQNRLRAMGVRWEPTPLCCAQCGEPRHSGSASLCRRCYGANAASQKADAQPPEERSPPDGEANTMPPRTRDGEVW